MRAPVGESATNPGPLPAESRLIGFPLEVLSRIALREPEPAPTTARRPFGETAIPATGRCARIVRVTRPPAPSTTDTDRPPAFVTNTRALVGSTPTAKGLRPTRSTFTVRSARRSTIASLRLPT